MRLIWSPPTRTPDSSDAKVPAMRARSKAEERRAAECSIRQPPNTSPRNRQAKSLEPKAHRPPVVGRRLEQSSMPDWASHPSLIGDATSQSPLPPQRPPQRPKRPNGIEAEQTRLPLPLRFAPRRARFAHRRRRGAEARGPSVNSAGQHPERFEESNGETPS